jgi:hypothetical protein
MLRCIFAQAVDALVDVPRDAKPCPAFAEALEFALAPAAAERVAT